MIITCDECATRFNLDESLLKPEGSKVRCSLCRHVFTALPPLLDTGLDLETEPFSDTDIQFDTPLDPLSESSDQEIDTLDSDTLDFDDTSFDEDLTKDSNQADIEISFEDEDSEFDLETDISFEAEEDEKEMDFLEMDSVPEPLDDEMPSETLKLTGDDAHTETGLEITDETEDPDPEDTTSEFDPSFDLDEQQQDTDDLDQEEPDKGDLSEKDPLEKSRLDEDELDIGDEFDEDDLDIGNELDDEDDLDDTDQGTSEEDALIHAAPPPRRPARASLIQPLEPDAEMGDAADAPPKKQPILGTPVLVLLLIFFLAAGGYIAAAGLGYKIPFLPEIQIPFIQQYLPQKTPDPLPEMDPVPDQKSVTGRFVTNDTAGELFIITGKIQNPSQIPYSHIQVKGTLFQKEKIAAMTQIAYCGNVVPEEVLKTGHIPDITAQLKKPRGAADTNVNVKPGDTVPFMLVFSDLPQNLENFTVEVTGFEKTQP
jgi:predicted Zn finger-like uncharacterized protein